jgi:hypothetical protein
VYTRTQAQCIMYPERGHSILVVVSLPGELQSALNISLYSLEVEML